MQANKSPAMALMKKIVSNTSADNGIEICYLFLRLIQMLRLVQMG
jgi:hypothetical protein